MTKRLIWFALIMTLLPGALLLSEEVNEKSLEELLKEALSIHIHASLSQDTRNVLWESEVVKLTIPGRPVTIHLKNDRARLSVHFTPYRKAEGGLILVAQSEIWLVQTAGSAEENGIRYYTSMKSIPLNYGEQVLFFPLGKMDNLNNPEKLHVEMAVLISPYLLNSDEASAGTAPESGANPLEKSVN